MRPRRGGGTPSGPFEAWDQTLSGNAPIRGGGSRLSLCSLPAATHNKTSRVQRKLRRLFGRGSSPRPNNHAAADFALRGRRGRGFSRLPTWWDLVLAAVRGAHTDHGSPFALLRCSVHIIGRRSHLCPGPSSQLCDRTAILCLLPPSIHAMLTIVAVAIAKGPWVAITRCGVWPDPSLSLSFRALKRTPAGLASNRGFGHRRRRPGTGRFDRCGLGWGPGDGEPSAVGACWAMLEPSFGQNGCDFDL